MREILDAMAVAERNLAACRAAGAELAHLQTQVATLQLLHRDLFSRAGARGRASATRAPLRSLARASGSRP